MSRVYNECLIFFSPESRRDDSSKNADYVELESSPFSLFENLLEPAKNTLCKYTTVNSIVITNDLLLELSLLIMFEYTQQTKKAIKTPRIGKVHKS